MSRYRNNKVILLGPSGVGKSSILDNIKGKPYNPNNNATIGVDFYVHTVNVTNGNDNVVDIVELLIWDSAGQERYKSILPMFIRHSKIVLICFEVPNISDINKDIETALLEAPDCKIYLIMTKCDDSVESKNYPLNDLSTFATINNYNIFYVSAKDNLNIDKLIYNICLYCINNPTKEEKIDRTIIKVKHDIDKEDRCCNT